MIELISSRILGKPILSAIDPRHDPNPCELFNPVSRVIQSPIELSWEVWPSHNLPG